MAPEGAERTAAPTRGCAGTRTLGTAPKEIELGIGNAAMEGAPVHTASSTSPSAAEDGVQSSAGSAGVRGSTGNSSEDSALVLSPRATRSHASACARAQPHARGSAAHAGKLLLVTPPLAEFLGVSSDVPTLTRLQVPTHPPAYPGAAQDSPPIRFACATVNSRLTAVRRSSVTRTALQPQRHTPSMRLCAPRGRSLPSHVGGPGRGLYAL